LLLHEILHASASLPDGCEFRRLRKGKRKQARAISDPETSARQPDVAA